MFIPQSPVKTDALFHTVPGFVANLEVIASHMAQAVATGAPPPMTFGVYGHWGAGKSTALNQLKAMVEDRLSGTTGNLTTSHYPAPVWQSTANPQATLAYTILQTIDPDAVFRAIRDHRGASDGDAGSFVALADAFAASPALHQRWMAQISDKLTSSAPADQDSFAVHIVFIDDLDRCTPSFTAELLAATTFWDSPDHANIFFVLAASEQHLVNSLNDNLPLGPHTPQQALEKYVHLSVTVPEMLTGPADIASFLIELCHAISDSDTMETPHQELATLLQESSTAYPDCVMAPLLEPKERLTPRAVKHRFNTFLAEFHPHGSLRPEDVKGWLIKAFWPSFWWRHLWPLKGSESTLKGSESEAERRHVAYVVQLTSYGRTLLPLSGLGDDELRPALDFMATRDGFALQGADPSLAIYLASDPPWQPPDGSAGLALYAQPGSDEELEIAEPADPRDPALTTDSSVTPSTASTPDSEALLHRLQAAQLIDEGNPHDARKQIEAVAQLARRGLLAKASGPTVGNVALLAERLRLVELARELHLGALDLSPMHVNVMQNLIEFVIDDEQRDLLPLAERLLGVLYDQGSTHKPDRTLTLEVRLGALAGQSIDSLRPKIEDVIRRAEGKPSVETVARILAMGPEITTFDDARRAVRVITPQLGDDDERYAALRMLADYLGRSNASADEREAVDMYDFILEKGLGCRAGSSDLYQIWHNMASLYASLGYTDTAVLTWSKLYAVRPMSDHVRRSFAVALDQLGADKAAAAVLLGQSLPSVSTQSEALPDAFSEDSDHWWTTLPFDTHERCPHPLTSPVFEETEDAIDS